MEQITVETTVIDRCVNCKGLWFDHLELDRLQRIRGSEKIDSGDEKTGRSFGTLQEIHCPRCKLPMLPGQDSAADLCYETCSQCQGVFLDAGEFKALAKGKSILDLFKDLF